MKRFLILFCCYIFDIFSLPSYCFASSSYSYGWNSSVVAENYKFVCSSTVLGICGYQKVDEQVFNNVYFYSDSPFTVDIFHGGSVKTYSYNSLNSGFYGGYVFGGFFLVNFLIMVLNMLVQK